MATIPLTARQESVWRYISSCTRSPTYDEMEAALGIGRSNLNGIISALKSKGFVTYTPGRARSLIALNPVTDLSAFTTAELAAEIARRLTQ